MQILFQESLLDDRLAGLVSAGIIKGTGGDDSIDGTSGNDTVRAKGGADLVFGYEGDDKLNGGAGDDVLYGGAGNDRLIGGDDNDYLSAGEGDDVIDGGTGYDRAAFYGASTGVHVVLLLQGIPQDTHQGMDTLINIENVSGTPYDDILVGDENNNWLWGSTSGADTLSGGDGDDLLTVGLGDSVLDGGSGDDTVKVDDNSQGTFTWGVNLTLEFQGQQQNTEAGWMTFFSVENLCGSRFDDSLQGNDTANTLAGGDGTDHIGGGRGADALYGDGLIDANGGTPGAMGPITWISWVGPSEDFAGGDDVLAGGDGPDTLVGGIGRDYLDGGKGADVFAFQSILDSSPDNPDYIAGLTKGDVIVLNSIDADVTQDDDQAFFIVKHFTGTPGELKVKYDREADITHLLMDVDGDRRADSIIDVEGHVKSHPFIL